MVTRGPPTNHHTPRLRRPSPASSTLKLPRSPASSRGTIVSARRRRSRKLVPHPELIFNSLAAPVTTIPLPNQKKNTKSTRPGALEFVSMNEHKKAFQRLKSAFTAEPLTPPSSVQVQTVGASDRTACLITHPRCSLPRPLNPQTSPAKKLKSSPVLRIESSRRLSRTSDTQSSSRRSRAGSSPSALPPAFHPKGHAPSPYDHTIDEHGSFPVEISTRATSHIPHARSTPTTTPPPPPTSSAKQTLHANARSSPEPASRTIICSPPIAFLSSEPDTFAEQTLHPTSPIDELRTQGTPFITRISPRGEAHSKYADTGSRKNSVVSDILRLLGADVKGDEKEVGRRRQLTITETKYGGAWNSGTGVSSMTARGCKRRPTPATQPGYVESEVHSSDDAVTLEPNAGHQMHRIPMTTPREYAAAFVVAFD